MQTLNLPTYPFRFKNKENKTFIFDAVRKKFVVLGPEEWVRQHVVQWLLTHKLYPLQHINIEKILQVNTEKKRYDIVVFNADGSIKLIVECKAPNIPITQQVFDQIARYNIALKAEYLMVTNGIDHYFCKISSTKNGYIFLKDIPPYIR